MRFGILNTVVVDDGIGMDDKQLKKLGQSFKKEENASVQHGVGLGLVTANDLCTSLAGHMTIKSQILKGTTVEFSLKVTNKEVKINVKSGQVEKLVKEVEGENRGSIYL